MTDFRETYGPWAVILGASDGTGAAFAEALAGRGLNVVLVARRQPLLEELAARLSVETRVVTLDLAVPGAIDDLAAATDDLDVGLVIYNAGADTNNAPLLDQPLEHLSAMVQRNCAAVLETAYRFGHRLVKRGRGGLVLVSSGAGWTGGGRLAAYGASKAFDRVLAEALWAEWKPHGVNVLSMVLIATDTPSLRRHLDAHGGTLDGAADPAIVVEEALAHLEDGPVWAYGMPDPLAGSPFAGMSSRQAVELMTAASAIVRAPE